MAIGPDTAPTQVLGCRPGGAARLRLTAPPPRPGGRGARPPGGPVRGALRAAFIPTPARSRAPLAACGGKARANNRGLARKRYTASYARGVALCPPHERRASAPLARPNTTRKRPFAISCAAFPACAVKAAQLIAGPLFTKRKPGQTCASLRPGRLPYNDHPRTPAYSPGCRRRPAFHKLKRPYAACGHVRLRRTAPPALQAKREETEPVMEEFNCGEKGKSSSSPRVSRKFNLAFHPLVERFPLPLFECRETISFATLV